jgi:hypothetical protein
MARLRRIQGTSFIWDIDKQTIVGIEPGPTPFSGDAADLTGGPLPDSVFPTTLPVIDGSNLTNLTAEELVGTLPDSVFPAILPAVDGSQLTGISSTADGWSASGETWTYATATTFTISGDLTTKYSKGDKIKLTQTTVKYFYIINVVHTAGTTTITITGGSDYTLANAAITSPYFSKVQTPNAFPHWFNATPTFTGFSTDPAAVVNRFRIEANMVLWVHSENTNGTSNATGFTISLPITAATITNASWREFTIVFDNSVVVATQSRITISSASTTALVVKDNVGTPWTAALGKRAVGFTISYEY